MANPSNNTFPPKLGFPQAFGNSSYQPVTQFSQFQAPLLNYQANGIAGAPSAAPFPTILNNQQSPFPSIPTQLPVASTQLAYNTPTHNFSSNYSFPSTEPLPPVPRAPADSGAPPTHKPYMEQTTYQPAFSDVIPNGLPNIPIPEQSILCTSSGSNMPASGLVTSSIITQQPQIVSTPMLIASIPPSSKHISNHMIASTTQIPPTINQTAMISTPSQIMHTQHGYNAPQPVQQITQNFGSMNMGPYNQHQQQSGLWTTQRTGNQVEVIDLMAERNILQYGFEDIQITLPHNMANNQARVDSSVFRSTLNIVPQTEELLKKSRLPFGLTLHPFRDMKNLNIIHTSTIVRCRYCRTYINPYVYLPDLRHWKCNMCNRNNDLPDDFCWDPTTKSFGDPSNRPEIRYSTVEFIAPNEYMLRPPQPPVYVFVLDVSAAAVESGYLYTFSEQLLINLDQLPGDDRTQVAFVCVDSSLHFFQFSSGNRRMPRELIVDDVDEIFLPSNHGLLVPLKKNIDSIRCFIEKLPVIFEKASSSSNCLGAALNIVQEMIAEVGGRISVFQSSIPNIGPGSLHPREDPNQRAANDVPNLGPATDFYKRLALECTGQQVALDLFMLNSQYSDLATLSEIAKFSTGCVYHFPNYHCLNDVVQVKRFEKILARYLTRKIGFEAVLRIRSSRGLALSAFYGNFFVRSTDLLALANVNPDSAIAVQINLEEKLSTSVCFQAALLYTSSKGDRRIRVHTICLPTTSDLGQVYRGLDLKAAISLLGKLGVDRSMAGAPLSDCREAIVNAVVDSLGAYMRTLGQGRATAVLAPRTGHLRLFPLYALAMLKHTSFCAGRSIKVDDRVAAMLMLRFCPLEQIMSEIYPQLYRLNEIDQLPDGEWPRPLPLSFEYITRDGIYVLEAGSSLYIYVSSNASQQMVHDLFGCHYSQIDEHSFREYENPLSQRAHIFLKHVTALKFYLGPVIIVREDSALREVFVRRLINDRSESTHSYVEFLQHIKRELGQ